MNFIEIKSEALEEVQEAHEHLNERSEEISNICFDYEDQNKIPIKMLFSNFSALSNNSKHY